VPAGDRPTWQLHLGHLVGTHVPLFRTVFGGTVRSMSADDKQRPGVGLIIVRYGLGAVMVLAGIVMIVVNPSGLGVDGFAMAVGGGLSVLLINFLFRLSVSSEHEREREEEARRYFDEHGEWPEEEPRRARHWVLAPGVMTLEEEEAQREADRSATRPNGS
jgi:hypothetical protein